MELLIYLQEKAYHYNGEQQEVAEEIEIPADLVDIVEQKRTELIEKAVEFDDELIGKIS